MRKILLLLTGVLTLSGLMLTWVFSSAFEGGGQKSVSLTHIWSGLFYLVIFPLYVSDHVQKNRAWLRRLRLVTASGAGQLAAGVLLLASGMVLLLYGNQAWQSLRQFHHVLTYPLLLALALHVIANKNNGKGRN